MESLRSRKYENKQYGGLSKWSVASLEITERNKLKAIASSQRGSPDCWNGEKDNIRKRYSFKSNCRKADDLWIVTRVELITKR